jgi:hypothetical protein
MADRAQPAYGAIDGFPRLSVTLSALAGDSARLPGPLAGIERFRSARGCLNSVGPVMDKARTSDTRPDGSRCRYRRRRETARVGAVPATGMQWHRCMVDSRDSMETWASIDTVYG